jgi:hypothetical protein
LANRAAAIDGKGPLATCWIEATRLIKATEGIRESTVIAYNAGSL